MPSGTGTAHPSAGTVLSCNIRPMQITRQREQIAAQREAIARQRASLNVQETELVSTSSSGASAPHGTDPCPSKFLPVLI